MRYTIKRLTDESGTHVCVDNLYDFASHVLQLVVCTWADEAQLEAQNPPSRTRTLSFHIQQYDASVLLDLLGLAAQHPLFGTDDTHEGAWDVAAQRWVSSMTVQEVKDERWSKIKTARMEAEFGGFTWDESVFDSDTISQSRIQGAVQLAQMALSAGQPWQIDWTLQDNTVRTLTGEDMFGVGVALGQHVAHCHETARLLREAIEAAQTTEDIEAVTWPLEP